MIHLLQSMLPFSFKIKLAQSPGMYENYTAEASRDISTSDCNSYHIYNWMFFKCTCTLKGPLIKYCALGYSNCKN